MYQLIVLFFEISMFRKGPQDVPASPWTLRLLLPAYFAVNLLILSLNQDLVTALQQTVLAFILLAAFSWPLLYFAGKPARFQQTLSALVGVDTMITLIALPAMASLAAEPTPLGYFAAMAMMLWHWLVNGHIYRHALDRPLFFGLGLALLYILISSQVMAMLFPDLSTPS